MRVKSVSRAKKHVHFSRSFDEKTLKAEADIWRNKDSYAYKAIAPLMVNLIAKVEYGLKLGVYSVMKKTGPLFEDKKDKSYYHSIRPYYWPHDLTPKNKLADKVTANLADPHAHSGFIHLDGMRYQDLFSVGRGRIEMIDLPLGIWWPM
jgi:hypothetical protein